MLVGLIRVPNIARVRRRSTGGKKCAQRLEPTELARVLPRQTAGLLSVRSAFFGGPPREGEIGRHLRNLHRGRDESATLIVHRGPAPMPSRLGTGARRCTTLTRVPSGPAPLLSPVT